MTKHEELVKTIKAKKENKYNFVPSGFNRFASYAPGWVKGTITAITGNADAGKTAFTNQFFLVNELRFIRAINDPKILDAKVFLVTLQRTEQAWRLATIVMLLFEEHNISISAAAVLSIIKKDGDRLNDEVVSLIEGYQSLFDYFDGKIVFLRETKPSRIKKIVDAWIDSGDYGRNVEIDADGNKVEHRKLHNKNMYPVVIVDSFLNFSGDFDNDAKLQVDQRGSIEMFIKFAKDWILNYEFAVIAVHPQTPEKEKIDKEYTGLTRVHKVRPSLDGLTVNKLVLSEYDLVLSLFYPFIYDVQSYRKFKVKYLERNHVVLECLVTPYGGRDTAINLWFNGKAGHFRELPSGQVIEDITGHDELEIIAYYSELATDYRNDSQYVR